MEGCIDMKILMIIKLLMIIWLFIAIMFFPFCEIEIHTDMHYTPTLIQLILIKIIFSMIFSLITTLLIGLTILGMIFLFQRII